MHEEPVRPSDELVLLYDGECAMCNRGVGFILRHEADSQLHFASQSSEIGKQLMQQFGVEKQAGRSMMLIEDGRCLETSEAVIGICRHLNRPWQWGVWLRALPRWLREDAYSLIARHRRQILRPKHRSSSLPRTNDRLRFLDHD